MSFILQTLFGEYEPKDWNNCVFRALNKELYKSQNGVWVNIKDSNFIPSNKIKKILHTYNHIIIIFANGIVDFYRGYKEIPETFLFSIKIKSLSFGHTIDKFNVVLNLKNESSKMIPFKNKFPKSNFKVFFEMAQEKCTYIYVDRVNIMKFKTPEKINYMANMIDLGSDLNFDVSYTLVKSKNYTFFLDTEQDWNWDHNKDDFKIEFVENSIYSKYLLHLKNLKRKFPRHTYALYSCYLIKLRIYCSSLLNIQGLNYILGVKY